MIFNYLYCVLIGFSIGCLVNELLNRELIKIKNDLLESKEKLIFAQKKYINILLEGIELRDRALEKAALKGEKE